MNKNPDFGNTGNSVWNQPYMDHLSEHFFNDPQLPKTCQEAQPIFLELYPDWIESSKLNNVQGLREFPYRFVSVGTTQALDWWHYWTAVNGYELKMFRGEYPYNRDVILNQEINWSDSIDDTGLKQGDAVMVSVPFSGTGRTPTQWDWLMEECNAKNIPVLVDMAWFGTCHGININVDHPCIKMVVFSTTKGLSCGNWRAGIAFSRINEGSLEVQTDWTHGCHLNTAIANELFRNFTPDTMPKKYGEAHIAICEHYGFETTNTIHIAQAPDTPEWKPWHRDDTYNRINIANALKRWKKDGTFYE